MICFKCSNETDFRIEETVIPQEYKGQLLEIKCEVTVCNYCNYQMLALGQTNMLMQRTKEQYLKNNEPQRKTAQA